jgi:hypothetical protein
MTYSKNLERDKLEDTIKILAPLIIISDHKKAFKYICMLAKRGTTISPRGVLKWIERVEELEKQRYLNK